MLKEWAMLPLRVGVGAMFMAHGMQKAFGLFEGPGIKGFAGMLENLGFAQPEFWAYVAAYVELLGGLCLILGIFTKVAAILLAALITVATVKVHLKNGFFMGNGGWEYNFVIMSALIALLLGGPGKLSINSKL